VLGYQAYDNLDFTAAEDYFDRSYASYVAQVGSGKDYPFFKAPASVEMAELAQFYKGMSLAKQGNTKLAVIAFKESLKLTTEASLATIKTGDGDPDKLAGLVAKLREDRKTTQEDLEILYNHKPNMAKQEGKGKGQGDPDEKQSEDPGKGNQAGKSEDDAL